MMQNHVSPLLEPRVDPPLDPQRLTTVITMIPHQSNHYEHYNNELELNITSFEDYFSNDFILDKLRIKLEEDELLQHLADHMVACEHDNDLANQIVSRKFWLDLVKDFDSRYVVKSDDADTPLVMLTDAHDANTFAEIFFTQIVPNSKSQTYHFSDLYYV